MKHDSDHPRSDQSKTGPSNGPASLKDQLDHASSLELFHLSVVIDTFLADPKRIIEIRRHLHIGQTVQFLDVGNPSLELKTVQGRVVALADKEVTLLDVGARCQWKLPYAAVVLPDPASEAARQTTGTAAGGFVYANEADHDRSQARPQKESSIPHTAPTRPTRDNFRVGDRVSFEDRYLRTRIGTIIRINQKTATLDCGDSQWRVSFSVLRPVIDL
jgi:hypothetical protein